MFLPRETVPCFSIITSIDEITDLKETIEVTTSSDEDDEEVLRGVTVSGVKQLETIYTCINCNKNVHPLIAHTGECNVCSITQLLTQPKQTAKLILRVQRVEILQSDWLIAWHYIP